MNNQTTFKVKIGEEDVTIRVKKPNPFKLTDLINKHSCRNGSIQIGSFLQDLIKEEFIISPKNLEERINESEDFIVVRKIFGECNEFFTAPSAYKLKQKEQAKSDSVGDNIQHESDEETNIKND